METRVQAARHFQWSLIEYVLLGGSVVGLWDPSLEFVAFDSTVWSVFMVNIMKTRGDAEDLRRLGMGLFSSVEKSRPGKASCQRTRVSLHLQKILRERERGGRLSYLGPGSARACRRYTQEYDATTLPPDCRADLLSRIQYGRFDTMVHFAV